MPAKATGPSCVWCAADARDTDRATVEFSDSIYPVPGTQTALCGKHQQDWHEWMASAAEVG